MCDGGELQKQSNSHGAVKMLAANQFTMTGCEIID